MADRVTREPIAMVPKYVWLPREGTPQRLRIWCCLYDLADTWGIEGEHKARSTIEELMDILNLADSTVRAAIQDLRRMKALNVTAFTVREDDGVTRTYNHYHLLMQGPTAEKPATGTPTAESPASNPESPARTSIESGALKGNRMDPEQTDTDSESAEARILAYRNDRPYGVSKDEWDAAIDLTLRVQDAGKVAVRTVAGYAKGILRRSRSQVQAHVEIRRRQMTTELAELTEQTIDAIRQDGDTPAMPTRQPHESWDDYFRRISKETTP